MAVRPVAGQRKAFSETLKLARMGVLEAQYEVALMYANGVGTAQDLEQAIEWVRRAAQRGLPAAQYLLASRYAHGVVVEKDEKAALWWYQCAAEQGHAKALVKWGRMVAPGLPEAALRTYRQAAELGLPEAEFALSQALEKGEGCEVDAEGALDWCLRAAQRGLAAAQSAMGERYAAGRSVLRDPDEAAAWFRLAARQNFARAQLALEHMLPSKSRRDKVRKRPSAAERRQSADRWLRIAETGDADTKYCVGILYAQGLGVDADASRARNLFLAAARQGHVAAQTALARLLETDDPAGARAWYEAAARAGDPEAQGGLGRLLAGSLDGEVQAQSLVWQLQAAQQGFAPAQLGAAQALHGDVQTMRAALLRRAACAGQVEAQYQWGCCLAQGLGCVTQQEQAVDWWGQAAQSGHVEAATEFGSALLVGDGVAADAAAARHWLEFAAGAGSAKAQWQLGGLYVRGQCGLPQDLTQAFAWCQKAADQGFAPALATLGVLYERIGKPENAYQCLVQAADAGDPEAQYNLALLWRNGNGVKKDLERAFSYFEKAAQQGVASAQARVALAYGMGEGVARDAIEAHKWLLLAARRGDALAKTNLEYSRSLLDMTQIKEAERRAVAWQANRANMVNAAA